MKIAVTSKGRDIDAEVDPRFGRAPYILVVDPENPDVEVLDNKENVHTPKAAGIQTAGLVCDKGVDVLLTGACGPSAFKKLRDAGINVANDISGTVKEAVDKFMHGDISFSEEANVGGPWKNL